MYALNRSEEVFEIKEGKNTVLWTHVLEDLKKERFFEKELQKTNQKELRIEKVIKRRGQIISLTVGLTKKISLNKISYFSDSYTHSKKEKLN